jgi:(p)ppGpp synthase/HD superfamily hydrolase
MDLTARFDNAFRFAHDLHRAQRRKGTSIPYVAHLMGVAALVVEHDGDEDQAIAALLHDGPEDHGGAPVLRAIERRFGADVARIVADCTDSWTDPKPDWRVRKEAYLAKLPETPERSLLVSLADKTNNAEAILYDWRALGEAVWPRFKGGADGTRWYYGALADFFRRTTPGRLSDRLMRAAREFSGGALSGELVRPAERP